MKAEFYFPEGLIMGYSDIENQKIINNGITNKVHNKLIELPCQPTKEMQVDIYSFSEIFGFTSKELDWINNNNQLFDNIDQNFYSPNSDNSLDVNDMDSLLLAA